MPIKSLRTVLYIALVISIGLLFITGQGPYLLQQDIPRSLFFSTYFFFFLNIAVMCGILLLLMIIDVKEKPNTKQGNLKPNKTPTT